MKSQPYTHPTIPREVQGHPLLPGALPLAESTEMADYLAGWTRIFYLRHQSFVNSVDAITPEVMAEIFTETWQDIFSQALGRFPFEDSQIRLSEIVDAAIARGVEHFRQTGAGGGPPILH
ncbi:hypothetical protein GTO89_10005 [Heliobacterium gestii]|uniref:Uncharacterized protein n=1 Tax=Heliomicrobium gestii TaxID=2699 RepID=A0A845LIV9_HELGE|nr:hypothetical protein [Heliomicrobium gestii]MBM7868175.1 hypothetical protein [Heliomicrobium gestii]MZP43373.1 hypothetical protein [Heliomicrobium gestii]